MATYSCKRCGRDLPGEAYSGGAAAKARRPGAWCRDCHRTYARERYARLPEERKRKYRAMTKAWMNRNKDHLRGHHRRWRLARHYGMTQGDYDARLAAQGGVCAICHCPEDKAQFGRTMSLAVDHDHGCCPGTDTCGKCVRGLVCSSCNKGLGAFGDDLNRVASAAAYLRRAAEARASGEAV